MLIINAKESRATAKKGMSCPKTSNRRNTAVEKKSCKHITYNTCFLFECYNIVLQMSRTIKRLKNVHEDGTFLVRN